MFSCTLSDTGVSLLDLRASRRFTAMKKNAETTTAQPATGTDTIWWSVAWQFSRVSQMWQSSPQQS